jgi:hypothetical protein
VLNTDKIVYPVKNEQYEVLDGIRPREFKGRMIGKASTQQGADDLRWTDVTIYVTEGEQYVIQKEGVSLVYHRAEASCRGGETVSNPQILEGSAPCPFCRPPSLKELDNIRANAGPEGDPASYRREVTLSRVDSTNDLNRIVPLLHYQQRLTTVGTEALKRAIVNDVRLREFFSRTEAIA